MTALHISLRRAFTGLTFLPWIALAHSDIAPLLVLHADLIETRVVWRRRQRPYSALAGCAIEERWRQTILVLSFHGTPFTFSGVLSHPRQASSAKAWIEDRIGMAGQHPR